VKSIAPFHEPDSGRDIALRCLHPRNSGWNPGAVARGADGAARRPYRVQGLRARIRSGNFLLVTLIAAVAGAGLAGCASTTVITPQGNGYEEVAHPYRGSTPADVRISFRYRAPDSRSMLIWPALYGINEVIHNDVAIFVGEVAYVSSDPNDPRGTRPHLFAVKAPAPPLDITGDILNFWALKNGQDPVRAGRYLSLVTPTEKAGRLELQLDFVTDEKNWPDRSTVSLDWNRVSDLMRDVQAHGTVHKDLRWGAVYLARPD